MNATLLALALATSTAPTAPDVPSDLEAGPRRSSTDVQQHELGAHVGFEPTLVSGAYLKHRDRGLFAAGDLELGFDVAPLTHATGYRGSLQRSEWVELGRQWTIGVSLGLRGSNGSDVAARYSALSVMSGLHPRWSRNAWALGVDLVYLTTPWTHFSFSPVIHDTYRERYPEERNTTGPDALTTSWSSNRLQALVALEHDFGSSWSWSVRAGLQTALGSGPDWANLELGQLPIAIDTRLGWRF
jgi:hypothetical protein